MKPFGMRSLALRDWPSTRPAKNGAEPRPNDPRYILTIHGSGYQLIA
jgi:hypothetical protein